MLIGNDALRSSLLFARFTYTHNIFGKRACKSLFLSKFAIFFTLIVIKTI